MLAFHLVEYAIEDFQGSGHLQVHQVLFDRLQGADGVHARGLPGLGLADALIDTEVAGSHGLTGAGEIAWQDG